MRIDADRLWDSLMRMAQIGATERGGVNRQTLTDLDREARDLFIAWCRDAGCAIRIDATGNIFARRAGRHPGHRAVLAGSHLDTQPAGGKFDGAYGVLSALEVVRTLNDLDLETEGPIEIVSWTNEEGSRFAPSMMGSGVFAGQFDPHGIDATMGTDGRSFGVELERIGYRGADRVSVDEVAAYFELHIEQGPGGACRHDADGNAQGRAARRCPDFGGGRSHRTRASARWVLDCRPARRPPDSRNTIPGRVRFTVDLRHPEEARLSLMRSALEAKAAAICSAAGLHLELEEIWHQSPLHFDAGCIEAVRRGAAAVGCGAMEIVSGAGHDACHIAERAPTAMIFIHCAGGISHSELEDAAQGGLCRRLQTAAVRRDRARQRHVIDALRR